MTDNEQPGRRRHLWVAVLAGLLVVAGAVVLTVGLRAQQHAPQPSAAEAAAVPSATSGASSGGLSAPSASAAGDTAASPAGSGSAGGDSGPTLPPATPTRLSVPSIGVDSSLLQLGLNTDQSIQVPPQARDAKAGWYKYSPSPGQVGPAVILGHVDSAQYGPGIFFKLGALKRGAMINVTRDDGTVAVFRVDRVVSYSKNNFPTLDVYGNTGNAALRLITCGGKFDFSKHSYESNIVAYASLVSSHHV